MPQEDLAWDAFEAFLATHPDLRHVELQGEGEPLLHPRFFDMVAACRERGIRIGIITNGSLLNEDRIERLVAGGIASIHVSMESAEAGQFQAIRGGAFGKVRDGLARLMAARHARGLAEPVVGLAVTVLKDTMPAIDGILALYRDLALDGGIVAQPLQRMPAYTRHYPPAITAQMLQPGQMPQFAAIRRALAAAAPVPSPDAFFYYALFRGFDPAAGNCPWLERGAYLGRDGRVTACCFMKDDALGDAVQDAPDVIVAERARLHDALEQGVVPDACRGCGTATAVARHRASIRPTA